MLATLLVIVRDHQNNIVVLRALCDLGSQINLITGFAAQLLNLHKTKTLMQIRNLGGDVVTASGIVWLALQSKMDNKVKEHVGAYIVPTLTGNLPKEKIDVSQWTHLRKIKLADRRFNIPSKVDVLLGADFYSRVIESGVRKMNGAPTAQRTSFGWIVFGGYSDALCHASVVNTATAGATNDQLLGMLTKFWEYDNVPKKRYRTLEEELCEQTFIKTININGEGRYIARMPLQPNAPPVTETYELAYARLNQMERRFNKDPTLKANYIKFMREYISLGHMEPVPAAEHKSNTAIYIPHHAAGTAKFRTVFDGS